MYTMWQTPQHYVHDVGVLSQQHHQILVMQQHYSQYHPPHQQQAYPCLVDEPRVYQPQSQPQAQYKQQRQHRRQTGGARVGNSRAAAAVTDRATTAAASDAAAPTTPAVLPVSSNPRASRNQAEKQRRDNLNTHIATMATLVPIVAGGGSRKKDKISILRLTSAYLRQHVTLGPKPMEAFLPFYYFNTANVHKTMVEDLAGPDRYLLVTSATGKIIYISDHVEKHLGHEVSDLLGDTIYAYIHEEDKHAFASQLEPDLSELGFAPVDSTEEVDSSDDSSASYRPDYSSMRPQRRSVIVRMAQRTSNRKETPHYEYVQYHGVLRLSYSLLHLRARSADEARRLCDPKKHVIFIAVGSLLRLSTVTEVSMLDLNKDEYCTRHLVDGRIIYCDHRISFIAGYLTHEVSGFSAFKYMHKDDVKWIMVATRQMFDQGAHGSSCYRLITRTGEFIYLKSHGYLEYDEKSQKVVSFICINSLTTQEEGEKFMADMKKRFAATAKKLLQRTDVKDFELESEALENPNLADPKKLEEVLTNIMDYPPSVLSEGRKVVSPLPSAQYVKAALYSQRLPPAELQASKIGINNVENVWPGKGKGKGKGKGSSTEASEQPDVVDRRNGERQIAEKRIPELDDVASPPSTSNLSAIKAEPEFLSPARTLQIYSPHLIDRPMGVQTIATSDQIQPMACVDPSSLSSSYAEQSTDLQRIQLKRPYPGKEYEDDRLPKKKADSILMAELQLNTNQELAFDPMPSDYIDVQPGQLVDCLSNQQNYHQVGTAMISISSKSSFNEFQELPDLLGSMGNIDDINNLFHNLDHPVLFEDIGNTHQYQNSDGAVVENDVNSAHVQMPNSMSSCESQISDDVDDPNADG